MIETIQQQVQAHWPQLGGKRPAPGRVQVLKLGWEAYPAPEAAIVLLAFADQDDTPCAVFKLARVVAGDALVRCESVALRQLEPLLPPRLLRLCPRLIAEGSQNGRAWLMLTPLVGRVEMHHTWGLPPRRALRSRMSTALAFARELRAVREAEPLGTAAYLERRTPDLVVQEITSRGWNRAESVELAATIERLWTQLWPAALAHGDLFPGNLLYRGDRLSGVVDWSFASERAPVFVDVLNYEFSFLLHATLAGVLPSLEARQRLQETAPLAQAHEELAVAGVDARCGSDARWLFLIAGSLRRTGRWASRVRTAGAFEALLRSELNALRAGAPRATSQSG